MSHCAEAVNSSSLHRFVSSACSLKNNYKPRSSFLIKQKTLLMFLFCSTTAVKVKEEMTES